MLVQHWMRCETWEVHKTASPWQLFPSDDMREILASVYMRAACMDATLGEVGGEATVHGCNSRLLEGSHSTVKETETN